MSEKALFNKEDMTLLRRPALACVVAAVVAAGVYFGVTYFSNNASAAFARARAQYDQVQIAI